MLVFHRQVVLFANTKATYNFWQSERVDAGEIIEAHQKQAAHRASQEKIILAVQEKARL